MAPNHTARPLWGTTMKKLNYSESIAFWLKNAEQKKSYSPDNQEHALQYGIYDDFPGWLNRYYAFFHY